MTTNPEPTTRQMNSFRTELEEQNGIVVKDIEKWAGRIYISFERGRYSTVVPEIARRNGLEIAARDENEICLRNAKHDREYNVEGQ